MGYLDDAVVSLEMHPKFVLFVHYSLVATAMQITGYLSDFSLAELFQFLEDGGKSGQLLIEPRNTSPLGQEPVCYIWFKDGKIVAASHRNDGYGLMDLIQKKGWISSRAATRIMKVSAVRLPLGICLKSQGLLEAEDLQLVFRVQVLRQVCRLFQLTNGYFHFENQVEVPLSEMSGLKALPREVTMAGLRALRDWTALKDKLPDPSFGLLNTRKAKPKFRFNQLEWQIWEFAQGSTSLRQIAKQLDLPLDKIQQAAFRLIVTGFLEEVPSLSPPVADVPDSINADFLSATPPQEAPVSHAFLQNLVEFLKGRV